MMWLATSAFLLGASPSVAQDESDVLLSAEDLVPICMSGEWRDVPQVSEAKRGQAFRIVVATRDVLTLEAKGFEITDCTVADLVTADKRRSWRNYVCEMAAYGNEAVQNQFERAMGARPGVLCASAELVTGALNSREQ